MKELIQYLRNFRDERNWKQFHNPKDLAIALSIEVNEVFELMRFKSSDEIKNIDKGKFEEELGDIFNFLVFLSDSLDIDLESAIRNNFIKIERKYPKDKVFGKKDKYR